MTKEELIKPLDSRHITLTCRNRGKYHNKAITITKKKNNIDGLKIAKKLNKEAKEIEEINLLLSIRAEEND